MPPAVPFLIRFWVGMACAASGVEPEIALGLIAQESMFNIRAEGCHNPYGRPHCFGLMQLHEMGAGYPFSPRTLAQPLPNILLGVHYLSRCQDAYPEQLPWQLACYQQGLEGVRLRGLAPSHVYITLVTRYVDLFREEAESDDREKGGYPYPVQQVGHLQGS